MSKHVNYLIQRENIWSNGTSAAPLALNVDARDVTVVAQIDELLEVVLQSRRAAPARKSKFAALSS
jgi:hypothetical protein